MEKKECNDAVKPFGIDYLEEIACAPEFGGASTCHTVWSNSSSPGVDDIDGGSNRDPC